MKARDIVEGWPRGHSTSRPWPRDQNLLNGQISVAPEIPADAWTCINLLRETANSLTAAEPIKMWPEGNRTATGYEVMFNASLLRKR